jgi:N-acetylmuramoyl-L-alanine amidase
MKVRCAPGTRGLLTGTPEYDVVLKIALLLETELDLLGFEVVLTRRSNEVQLSNAERADIANRSNASCCIKLHCNGVRSYLRYLAFWKRGTITLFPAATVTTTQIYKSSKLLAKVIHQHLIQATQFPDLGIRERDNLTGFNWSTIPTVLLEIGYITNPVEEARLINTSFQKMIATAIAKGIVASNAKLGF